MIASTYMRNGRSRIDLWPLAAFDHPAGRRRDPLDPQHEGLARLLSLSFAGIANKPGADELFRCMIAPRRARWQTAWLVDVLKVAAVDPPQLVKLVREDALSIYDLAAVVTEARCDYGLRTDWLNKHAPPPAGLPRPRPKQLGGTAPSGIALNCVRRGTQGHSPHVGLISYIHGPSGGP